MPVIGGYWLSPFDIASVTACTRRGSESKSGKPCPRFTAPFSAASADITVKMVVPTAGSFVSTRGVCTAISLKLIVVAVAAHGLGDQVAVEPVRQQLRELEDEVAKVRAALERDTRDVLAEQVAQRAHHQVVLGVRVAHGHFRDDADAQSQAHIGLD